MVNKVMFFAFYVFFLMFFFFFFFGGVISPKNLFHPPPPHTHSLVLHTLCGHSFVLVLIIIQVGFNQYSSPLLNVLETNFSERNGPRDPYGN